MNVRRLHWHQTHRRGPIKYAGIRVRWSAWKLRWRVDDLLALALLGAVLATMLYWSGLQAGGK